MMRSDSPTTAPRLYALDNLRAAMMWLGIVLHVAVMHMSRPSLLPWHDDRSSPVADFLTAFIHAFRMPVFFILAGFFVALLVQKRGAQGMLRHRLLRLGLPFALFWPVLFPLTVVLALLFMHRMVRGTWGVDPELMRRAPGVPRGPATMHLWFLWMLLWFSVFAAFGFKYSHWIPARVTKAASATLGHVAGRAWGFAVLALPLAWLGASYPDGIVAPSGSFLPPLAEWLHNGLFFVVGLVLHAHQAALFAAYQRRWVEYAVAGGVCFLIAGALIERHTATFWSAYAYNAASWLWSFALIGAALRHVARPRRWLVYLADSSYWVYLVHLPLTVGFGALLYGAPLPALAKMVINIGATTALCLFGYQWLVRRTALGQLLNGKRHPIPRQGQLTHATPT